jgi:hypothetical protein
VPDRIEFTIDESAPKPFSQIFEVVYQRKDMRVLTKPEIKKLVKDMEKERKASIRDNFEHALRLADFIPRANQVAESSED